MIEWFRRKREYVDWEDYKHKVNFIDRFEWQQRVRRRNIK